MIEPAGKTTTVPKGLPKRDYLVIEQLGFEVPHQLAVDRSS
jgi:hypothetical protein